jgi:hypothetical protein
MDGIVRHLSASANCFDGKSDGESLSGLLFLNFTEGFQVLETIEWE